MDRELKFRAVIEKKYCFNGKGITLAQMSKLGDGFFQGDVQWLQYTGRKDRNAKEIYKGELLEYPVTSYPLEVVWDDFSCAFMLRDTEGDLMAMPTKESMAEYSLIVGNIYEKGENNG